MPSAEALLAVGFEPAATTAGSCWVRTGQSHDGLDVLVFKDEPPESPVAFLDRCQQIHRRVRTELVDGGENTSTLHYLLSPFRRARRKDYRLVICFRWIRHPEWIDAMLSGALVDHPKRCLVVLALAENGELKFPRGDVGVGVEKALDWATRIMA